ncbi:UDP-glucuronosyltransferase 1-1 [Homalodisca vitripennis]|nr:UDP-glucuronosyltransferase 1-1 [Homalodisca vitripennis]
MWCLYLMALCLAVWNVDSARILVFQIFAKLIQKYYAIPKSQTLITEHYGSSTPQLHKLILNTSLLFMISHISLGQSRPFPPNVIEIGGIHTSKPPNKLPKDLQQILDQSPQGVIIVSFGSLVYVSSIPDYVIRIFLKAFSSFPQTVQV